MRILIALWCLAVSFAPAVQAAPVLRALSVTGNESVPAGEVLGWAGSRPGDPYTAAAMTADRRAIEAGYRGFGYLAAQAVHEVVAMSPDSSRVDVRWTVDEGKRTVVGSIALVGAGEFPAEELLRRFETSPGEPLREEEFEADMAALLGRYEERGYAFARCAVASMAVRRGEEADSIDLRLEIEEGRRVTIEEIRVEGTEETNPEVVVRETRIQPGEVYDPDRVGAIRDRLARLNIFSAVEAPELYLRDGRGGLLITVREGPTNTFDGVVGYVPESAGGAGGYVTGLVSVGMRNLFGTGRKLAFRWYREDQYSQELMVRYTEPWIFSWPLNLGGGFYQRQQDSAYVRRVVDLRGDLLVSDRLTLGAGVESASTIPSADSTVERVRRSSSIALGASLAYDSRDDLYAPGGGVLLRTDYHLLRKSTDPSGAVTGQKSSQQRITTDLELYVSTWLRQVIALGAHFRQITGGDIEESDLFRMGGAQTLRGYRENQFLGSSVVWANGEYRLSLARRTFVFAFLDAGYFSRPPGGAVTGSSDLLYGYGIGMRLTTGIGLLGVSLALGRDDTFATAKVHVSLINEF